MRLPHGKKVGTSPEEGRYESAATLVNMAMQMALSPRGFTVAELAIKHQIHAKTVRRMLFAMERKRWPVYTCGESPVLWRIDRHWMSKFL